MSLSSFIKEFDNGLRLPVYLLYAEDPFLLKEACLMISASVNEPERDFCFNCFDLNDRDEPLSFEQMFDVLNTMPFGSSRRTVIIENMQEVPKKNLPLLERYITNPSASALLVMLHKGRPKPHFAEVMKKLKAMPLDIRSQDIPVWIKEKARQKGFIMSDSAVNYLIGVIGPDLGLISSELEKFSLLEKEKIDPKDIAGLIRGSSDYDVFDLTDALVSRDESKALKIAKIILESQEPYSLLGAINWQYARMYRKNRSSEAYFTKVFELLNEADYMIKSSGGVFPMEYLLVRLLRL